MENFKENDILMMFNKNTRVVELIWNAGFDESPAEIEQSLQGTDTEAVKLISYSELEGKDKETKRNMLKYSVLEHRVRDNDITIDELIDRIVNIGE